MTIHRLYPLALALATLVIANLAFLNTFPETFRVDVGNYRDFLFVESANRQEAADGVTYRWTTERTTLSLTQGDMGPHSALMLHLGGRPAPGVLQVQIDERPFASFSTKTMPRQYDLLLPDDMPVNTELTLTSDTFSSANDPRRLGVKLDAFTVRLLDDALNWPNWVQWLAQLTTLIALQLTALTLRWRAAAQYALGIVIATGLAFTLSYELLQAFSYLPRLAGAATALALLTWIVLPRLERLTSETAAAPGAPTWGTRREMRLLWTVMLLACVIRLIPILYPTFGGQDLGRNVNRLVMVISGQLVIIAPSAEFARGLTIYPPGPYLALMPLELLFRDLGLTLQGPLALLDGTTALLAGLIARRIGAGPRGALLAAALYGGNLAAFAGLSYSFSAQVFGQWLTAPIALLLMASAANAPHARAWLLAALLTLAALLSHIGVAFLAGVWMAFAVALVSIVHRRIAWRGVAIMAAIAVLAFGLLYIEIIDETVSHATAEVLPGEAGELLPGYRILMINGLRLAFSDPGLALIPLGIILAAGRIPGETWAQLLRRNAIPLAALLTLGFYWLVALRLDVQVRFFYFSLPFVLAAMGLALGKLATRGQGGRLTAWALTLAVIAPQIFLWFQATFADGKIPLTPLTH